MRNRERCDSMNWRRYLVIATAALLILLMGVGAFIYETSNSPTGADSSKTKANQNITNKTEQQIKEQSNSNLNVKQCKEPS
jgi:uncharacterized protein YpmS